MSRPPLLLTFVLLAQFAIPLSISGIAVALPQIATELGATPIPLQWVVNGFNVSFAICTVVWGALSDRIGYGRSFRIGVGLAVVGALASMVAPNLGFLDAARVVAGIGSAAVLTGAAPIITRLFDGAGRARAFAWFGTINGLGLAAGPVVSGLLLSLVGWRGILAVHALVLLVAFVGTAKLPPFGDQTRHSARLLDIASLARPGFAAMAVVPVAGAIGFVTFLTYLPAALSAVHGLPAGAIGALMLTMTVPVLLAPGLVLRAMQAGRAGPRTVVLASLASLAVGGLGVALGVRPDLPVAVAVVPMILLGLGFGLPLGFVDAEALAAVPAERAGAASGVLNMFRIGSEAVAVAAYAAILAAMVTSALPGLSGQLTAAGAPGHPWVYQHGLIITAMIMVGLVLVAGIAFVWLSARARVERSAGDPISARD